MKYSKFKSIYWSFISNFLRIYQNVTQILMYLPLLLKCTVPSAVPSNHCSFPAPTEPEGHKNNISSGLKLPQKSREKSLLPPAELGRSEILAGRSEILTVAETCHDLSRELLLLCLYLSPHFTFHPIYVQCNVFFTFYIQ